MDINLGPELEAVISEQARRDGIAPEALVVAILRQRLLTTERPEPRDEWERGLLEAATDCGVSLSNEALSRDEIYED